jgi:two-component system, OmpR family, heavy metal sensor histidine kinase CusS
MAVWLTLWFAGSSSALVLVATVSLYCSISANLDAEIDEDLQRSVDYYASHLCDIDQYEDEAEDWSSEYARIIESDGRVLFSTPRAGQHLPPSLEPGRAAVDRRMANGRWVRALSRRVDGRIYQVSYDRTREVDFLGRYRRNVGVVLVPALLACAAVGVMIARKGLRPLGEITSMSRRIGPSRLNDRIPTKGLPSELRELATTFNAMLGRLQDSFARLERFSADIAHELRTPVHSLRNVAEIALQGHGSQVEDREALSTCLESADRLAGLIERLLFLAQADDPRKELARDEVDVIDELEAVCAFCEPLAVEAGVQLVVEAPGPIRFDLERALFRRAVGNLITNALAHTPVSGRVTVSAREESGRLAVSVADTGLGIAAEHLPHLFDRFYRVDAARTAGDGVGLGLAIVRSIAEMHGGHATAESRPSEGTVVTLSLPRR